MSKSQTERRGTHSLRFFLVITISILCGITFFSLRPIDLELPNGEFDSSILPQANPDIYDESSSRAFEPSRPAYADFWDQSRTVQSHAGVLETSRQELRTLIWNNQNPKSCDEAELCTCWTPHGGLFSTIHSHTTCLIAAVARGCTLVFEPSLSTKVSQDSPRLVEHKYVDHRACLRKLNKFGMSPKQSRIAWLECYFKPVSSCQGYFAETAKKVGTLKQQVVGSFKDTSSTPDPAFQYTTHSGHIRNATHIVTDQRCFNVRRYTKLIRKATGLTSSLLVNSEILSYLMRPNKVLVHDVARWAKRLGVDHQSDLNSAVSVHIRHGDKRAVDMEEKNRTRIVGVTASMVRLLGSKNVLLMTDDQRASKIMHTLPLLPAHSQQGDDAIRTEGKLQSLNVVEIPISEVRKSESIVPSNEEVDTTMDPAGLLFVQVILLSQAQMLIGTQVSNVDRAIVELMAAVKYPPRVFDMYMDAYAPCANRESHTDWAERSEKYWNMANV